MRILRRLHRGDGKIRRYSVRMESLITRVARACSIDVALSHFGWVSMVIRVGGEGNEGTNIEYRFSILLSHIRRIWLISGYRRAHKS